MNKLKINYIYSLIQKEHLRKKNNKKKQVGHEYIKLGQKSSSVTVPILSCKNIRKDLNNQNA